MSAAPLETALSPWPARRRRAEALGARHAFAAELMTLYQALLAVQEDAWHAVRESSLPADELVAWTNAVVVPAVVEATEAAGPATLGAAARRRVGQGAAADVLDGWLAGARLEPVDHYLARASLGPVLEALGERAGSVCAGDGEQGERCPCCGGRPQLSCVASSGESLVSGPRNLLCARCGSTWSCSRSVCPACGERREARLSMYAERWAGPVSGNGNGNGNGKDDGDDEPVFPHLRIASCSTCDRYLIEVDMAGDPRAVPEVDELAALPLDLYAADQGLTKVTPNLMGF